MKSKPQRNETVPLLQYCKLSRSENYIAKELIDHLRVKAKKCRYKENNRQLKEQFINGISDDIITAERRTLPQYKNISDIISK